MYPQPGSRVYTYSYRPQTVSGPYVCKRTVSEYIPCINLSWPYYHRKYRMFIDEIHDEIRYCLYSHNTWGDFPLNTPHPSESRAESVRVVVRPRACCTDAGATRTPRYPLNQLKGVPAYGVATAVAQPTAQLRCPRCTPQRPSRTRLQAAGWYQDARTQE